jgi:hypothetical protein
MGKEAVHDAIQPIPMSEALLPTRSNQHKKTQNTTVGQRARVQNPLTGDRILTMSEPQKTLVQCMIGIAWDHMGVNGKCLFSACGMIKY